MDGKPRKIYLGYGPAGRAHEILDRQAKRKKQPVLDAQARVRQLMREGDRLWCESWTWLWLLVESWMLLAGYYRHRGEWRRASRKPRTRQSRALPAAPEVVTDLPAYLRSLNQQANGGEPDAIDALRVFLDENRAILAHVEDLNRASMRLWEGHQYQPLDQDRAESSESGSLERLLVDAVRIAEMNRRHADSLIEPGAVTAIACSTRYARIQKADNRLVRHSRGHRLEIQFRRIAGSLEQEQLFAGVVRDRVERISALSVRDGFQPPLPRSITVDILLRLGKHSHAACGVFRSRASSSTRVSARSYFAESADTLRPHEVD